MVQLVLISIRNQVMSELHTIGLRTEQTEVALDLAGQIIQNEFNNIDDYEELASLFKSKLKLRESLLMERLKQEYKVNICAMLGKQFEMISYRIANYIIPMLLTEISNKPEVYGANGTRLKMLLKQEKKRKLFFLFNL